MSVRPRPADGTTAGLGANWTTDLTDNYWGTDNPELVQYMVYDYFDDFTSGHIDYGTPPSIGFESTYPFVEEVLINGESTESVPEIGAGRSIFTIYFPK